MGPFFLERDGFIERLRLTHDLRFTVTSAARLINVL